MKKYFLLMVTGTLSCFGIEWKTSEIEGVEYVPLKQVGEFYQLEVTDGVILKNKELTLKFEKDSKNCSFNKVKFELSHPLLTKDEAFHLAAKDLTHILEPVLRPSKVEGLNGFDTVLLDLVIDDPVERGKFFEAFAEKLVKRGFEVVDLKLAEAVEGSAVYLQVVVEEGAERALRTSVIGTKRKAGMGIATALHWSVILQKKLKLKDGRVALGDDEDFEKLIHPGARLALTLEPDWNGGSEDFAREFRSKMGQNVANALHFAKKAAENPKAAAKEEK